MYNKQASGQQGFTLIEAMIVVAVIAVLLAVAVPSFSNFFEKNRLKRATEEVYGLITKARAEGVIRDTNMSVAVDTDAWCLGYAAVVGCDCTETDLTEADACAVSIAGTPVRQVVSGANFTGVDMAGSDIDFNHVKGTASAGSVTLASGVWALKIMVSNVGRVRICTPSTALDPGGAKSKMMGYGGC